MTTEVGHAPTRTYRDKNGDFHLNGAKFFNDAEQDIADSLEQLNALGPTEIGYLDGAAPGTATAEHTVIYDAAGRIVRNVAAPAAAGANQGAATALTKDLNAVTGADGAKGVRLPVPAAGAEILIINTDAAGALLVYPATDGAINALGANNAFTLAAGKAAVFIATAAGQWYTAGIGVAMSGDATQNGAGAITIANEAVTVAKMADLARGSIISGQTADNRPTALDAKGNAKILVGDGTDVKSVSVSGDATMDNTGAVTIATAPATGKVSVGLFDFNATGDCDKVTVGVVDYTRGASDPPNGVWAEGANPAASATALAGAINNDTRNGGGPYYAAVASGTTVFVFALAAGVAGNVVVSKTGGANPDVAENLVGGVAVGAKRLTMVTHTVTTEEGTQVEAHVPLPFTPTTFTVQVRDSTGAIKAVTDVFTIAATPNRIVCATGGATHIAATDTITVTAME